MRTCAVSFSRFQRKMLSVLPFSLGYVAAPNAVVHAAPQRPQRAAAPTAQAAPPAAPPAFDVKQLPGVTGPFGFFDPLGFSSGDVSQGKVKFYREAEIKHGRVAMLASVGFLLGEVFHPMWGGSLDLPSVIAFQETPLQDFIPGLALPPIFHEAGSIFTFNSPFGGELWSIRTDYASGDLGWDPLGLKPTNPSELKEMQTKEINNGRLAMIGIVGMVGQELASGKTLF